MIQYTPASDKFVHNVSVDFRKRIVSEQIHLVQYDNSLPIIAASLYSDYAPYSIPINAEGNIRLKKQDGTYIYNPALGCNSDGTILYFEITNQMTMFPGVLNPIIEIKIGTMVAASGTIKIEIDKNPVQEGDIESTNEYKTIEGYVEIVKQNATAAKESEENAKLSENASKISEGNAKTSETNAKASEVAAAASASNASSYASAASLSADKAKTSETNATTSETKAKISETNAKASETAAKTSEVNASNSESAAATSASNALSSETKAKTSETNAKTSETNAKDSEDKAKTSETNAKTSETNASASATNAATSASNAKASETNAANSASAAKSSEDTARLYAQQAKDTDVGTLISQLGKYKITTKLEDAEGNYILDSDGNYMETEIHFASPDDILSVLEKVMDIESRLSDLEKTAIQGVIL